MRDGKGRHAPADEILDRIADRAPLFVIKIEPSLPDVTDELNLRREMDQGEVFKILRSRTPVSLYYGIP